MHRYTLNTENNKIYEINTYNIFIYLLMDEYKFTFTWSVSKLCAFIHCLYLFM